MQEHTELIQLCLMLYHINPIINEPFYSIKLVVEYCFHEVPEL
ncbi:hypothetical protein JOD20_000217 [Herpetosiphon giganteus]|nr:hypothetical protein [Herpetosiphon giganteus]